MHLDNLTILFCLLAAAILLACAFAGVQLTNRNTKGAGYFAAAFGAGAISCALFVFVAANGWWGTFLNTIVGDTLVCVFLTLLQLGIRSNLGLSVHRRMIGALPLIPFFLLYYYTEVRDSLVARIVILALYGFFIRLMTGRDLVRHGKRRSQHALAWVMFLFAAVSLWQAVGTLLTGAPADYMRPDLIQSSVLFLYLLFLMAAGLLLFLLLNDELMSKLEDEAERDFLTGALNRRGIERALHAELVRSSRRDEPLVLGLIDIDYFKRINDTDGHSEGDRIVREVAELAVASLRPYDYVGRFGGDEFLILLPGTDAHDAIAVAERIRSGVAARLVTVSVSIGLTAKLPGDDIATLTRRADDALYVAKQEGRNSIRLA
ncbi:diguanylate cyclase (GGDEF) domain-containing protein [Terriglobus roseus DSM 18391]|uniref:diguanylate cyclase n=1 Tax=Terriglobus roseus (strain DSM 18391 / NRRL B-41598 / KBS 63) TaxID=926566 RepID=I3ZLF5_TERRK|nr:GGDEF domain-containing protein [Terriglobus roseus]AFL90073.1 diguanylate cyclase (GGDEF) domain-containing protein [Terriglobus roseus DSM 18391]